MKYICIHCYNNPKVYLEKVSKAHKDGMNRIRTKV